MKAITIRLVHMLLPFSRLAPAPPLPSDVFFCLSSSATLLHVYFRASTEGCLVRISFCRLSSLFPPGELQRRLFSSVNFEPLSFRESLQIDHCSLFSQSRYLSLTVARSFPQIKSDRTSDLSSFFGLVLQLASRPLFDFVAAFFLNKLSRYLTFALHARTNLFTSQRSPLLSVV